MAVLDVNRFLTELASLYQKCKVGEGGKSVSLTMKRSSLKPRTRKQKKTAANKKEKAGETFVCLVRASLGKKKVSTVVNAEDHLYFLNSCNTICKAHMDALKQKDRSKKKNKK
jgi:signal recognition particle subunit SRP14